MHISIIGYGNLAKAIVNGLLKNKQHRLSVSSPSLTPGETQEGLYTHCDNKEIIQNADVIILAVKPKVMAEVLQEISHQVPEHCLFISVAAGLSLEWFRKRTKPGQALIRTIPNTPATIGKAATPMIANEYVSDLQKHYAEEIFNSIGITTWALKEEDINTFTALSASGPAYVFLFMETLIEAAVKLGLEKATATQFAIQMVIGAAELAQISELDLSQLKKRVATPGGTTAAALDVLETNLHQLVFAALSAAKNRSIELGQIQ